MVAWRRIRRGDMRKFIIGVIAALLVLSSCASTGPSEREQDSVRSALMQDDIVSADSNAG